MVRSIINDRYDFLIEKIRDQIIVNGEQKKLDICKIDQSNYHIIHKNKSYRAGIIHSDLQNKTFEIKVNNRSYRVSHQDENDILMEKIGIKKRIDTIICEAITNTHAIAYHSSCTPAN